MPSFRNSKLFLNMENFKLSFESFSVYIYICARARTSEYLFWDSTPNLHSHFLRARPPGINTLSIQGVITSQLLNSCDACFSFNFDRRFLFYPYFLYSVSNVVDFVVYFSLYLVSVLHITFVNMFPNKSYILLSILVIFQEDKLVRQSCHFFTCSTISV